MSKIDQKYIDALDNFTGALEEIVETLKEQQKTNKADVVNEMLNNTPINNINNVVKDLKKTVDKGFASIKTDNKTIIKEIKTLKSQKQTGTFGEIEDPKNKNKIVDGIKVVMLIAGGVLALGMAFKIIGKVDFMSVAAISTAVLIMATTYAKISETVNNSNIKDLIIAAAIIPVLALGLAASGFILSFMPTISPMQGLSMLLIAGSLSIASYFLLKSIKGFDSKSLLMVPLLPIILPMIALGIVASSYILKHTQQMTFMQVLSVGLIGLALGVATVSIAFALKAMKGVSWKEMLMLPAMIPLIAGGIVLASLIFKGFVPINDPVKLLIGSAVIGLSMLFFVPTIKILGKMKTGDLIRGGIAVIGLSFVMKFSSQILEDFEYVKDPLKLGLSALAMGVSLLLFTPAIWVLGKLGVKSLAVGLVGALAVAGAILGVSHIFAFMPDNLKYPDIMWSLGAGLTILGFGIVAAGMGFLMVSSGGIGALALAAGLVAMLATAGTIVGVSKILNKGDYSKFPPLDWAMGVGLSIVAFSVAAIFVAGAGILTVISSLFTGDKDPLLTLAKSMVDISFLLQDGKWDGGYPSLGWAAGVGASLMAFAGLTVIAGGVSLVKGITSFFTGDEDPLLTVVKSMVAVSKEIQEGNYSGNYPSLKWSLGVGGALSAFAGVTVLAGFATIAKTITSIFGDDDPLLTLTKSIVGVSKEIQAGNYGGNYPSVKWSLGVGGSLSAFAAVTMLSGFSSMSKVITRIFGDGDPLKTLAKSMVSVSKEIQEGNYSGNYPKEEWALGVGKALKLFAGVTILSSGGKLAKSITSFFTGSKEDPLKTLAQSMVDVSKLIQKGVYTGNYPTKEYSEGVSHFIITISDMVDDYDISSKEATTFRDTTSIILPAINSWTKMLSQGDLKNIPDKDYSENLVKFILGISKMVDEWDPNITDSKQFTESLAIILPSIKNISGIPTIDKSFSKSMGYVENGLDDIGDAIYDFKKLKLSLKDLDDFSKSMKYITIATKELQNIPNINDSMVDNMVVIKDSLEILSEGVDSFMYTGDGVFGKKRSMLDFMEMSVALTHIVSSLQVLSTMKSIPSGVLNGFTNFLSDLDKIPKLSEIGDSITTIGRLSDSFVYLANSLSLVNSNLQGFNDISQGLHLISLIDETNFDNVLKSVDKHKGTLQVIGNIPEEQVNLLSVIKTLTDDIVKMNTEKEKETTSLIKNDNTLRDKQQKQFYEDVSEIRSLLYDFKDHMDKPSASGTFNKYK